VINMTDVIYQMFAILIPVTLIILIFFFVRSSKKRNEQLKRLEAKIDNLQKKS
jgi:preprotein translocase subunit YajC